MQCPNGDGDLITYTTEGPIGTITFHRCPTCGSTWLDEFSANYATREDIPDQGRQQKTLLPHPCCPICNQHLAFLRGDNIPPGATAWRCPDHHGFLFPAGAFAAFKEAQVAKITYHKLWGVPLPPLRSVLLASIVILGAIGSAVVYTQFRQTQVSQSQAKEVIQFHEVITDQTTRTATIIARTSQPLELTVTVSQVGAYMRMSSPDGRTHSLRFGAVPTGTYFYSFSYTAGGKLTHSESFSFSMP